MHKQVRKQTWVPDGDIVLSKTVGIVISIMGRWDGKPFSASCAALCISSMLQAPKLYSCLWIKIIIKITGKARMMTPIIICSMSVLER